MFCETACWDATLPTGDSHKKRVFALACTFDLEISKDRTQDRSGSHDKCGRSRCRSDVSSIAAAEAMSLVAVRAEDLT